MLGSNDYQVQAMEKEEAKLRFKREQNEIRRQRFQNARVRTIGVDVDALNAQVEEKRQGRNNLEESNRQESMSICILSWKCLISVVRAACNGAGACIGGGCSGR